MKHLLNQTLFALLLTLFIPINLVAQEAFKEFEKDKQVNNVIVNKKMFEMMSSVKVDQSSKEDKAYFNLISKLDDLRVFSTKNNASKEKMKSAVNSFVSQKELKQYATNNKDNVFIEIYINKNGTATNVSELVLYNQDNAKGETSIMYLKGGFSINEISALTNKMNLPINNSF
ncbi:DUF4252 domain-containing protein [Myroides pelagicus]|uniref:DUF4252 domain-containing protein n=1 Tax=Myroides pelagicus TaxID=270914 RepID=A0A7K1GMP9_9FLAO|nr:DUF4252 domain-containing protein [Myroides pelagicus]MEC4114559.1 DUF4252 domain-containing protein [Myroides pelagicus]MTH30182.1 DUF4252 domain-containing protein [Myroides pelagicus]